MIQPKAGPNGKLKLVSKRVNVPLGLWRLIEELAVTMDATPKWCFNMLLDRVEYLVLSGKDNLFGFEFERARLALANQGKPLGPSGVPTIDINLLHQSDKLKSGFVGVYANGTGFRAMGINPATKTMMTIGTFPTSERAAEMRRMHYLKHNLPYGSVADQLTLFANTDKYRHLSDETKRRIAINQLAQSGTPAENISEEDRRWETEDPYIAAAEESAQGEARDRAGFEEHLKKLAAEAKARRTEESRIEVAKMLRPLPDRAYVDLTNVAPTSGVLQFPTNECVDCGMPVVGDAQLCDGCQADCDKAREDALVG